MNHLSAGFTVGFRLAAVGLGVCVWTQHLPCSPGSLWHTISMHSKSISNSHRADPCHTLAGSNSTVSAAFSSPFPLFVIWQPVLRRISETYYNKIRIDRKYWRDAGLFTWCYQYFIFAKLRLLLTPVIGDIQAEQPEDIRVTTRKHCPNLVSVNKVIYLCVCTAVIEARPEKHSSLWRKTFVPLAHNLKLKID